MLYYRESGNQQTPLPGWRLSPQTPEGAKLRMSKKITPLPDWGGQPGQRGPSGATVIIALNEKKSKH